MIQDSFVGWLIAAIVIFALGCGFIALYRHSESVNVQEREIIYCVSQGQGYYFCSSNRNAL